MLCCLYYVLSHLLKFFNERKALFLYEEFYIWISTALALEPQAFILNYQRHALTVVIVHSVASHWKGSLLIGRARLL